MKAAFLIRCSTKKQDYQRQVNDLTRLAKAFGFEYNDEIIYGEHITGKDNATIRDRESVARLKADATTGKFDVVLVSEVSRMSRDVQSGTQYVRELTNMQIPIFFKDINTWTIDPITHIPTRNAEEVIINAFLAAWKYLKSMKTQIASGRRNELDNNCISIGKPFFGYKRYGGRDKATKNRIVKDEEAAKVVVEVFNEYLKEGSTLKSTALAITAKYGEAMGRKFSIGSIEHILTYEPYATGVKVFTLKDPDEPSVVDRFNIEFPILISKETFEAAKTKRVKNRVKGDPYPKQKTHLLSRLLKCPCCNYTMTPRKKADEKGGFRIINGSPALSWICMSGVNNTTDCTNRMTVANEKLEPLIWEFIKSELIELSNINKEDKKAKIAELNEQKKEKETMIGYLVDNNESQKAKISRAYKAFTEAPEAIADIAQQDYYNTASKANKEIKDNDNKIEGLRLEIDSINNQITFYSQPSLPEDIVQQADNNFELKRKMIKELITKIVPYKITTFEKYTREKGKGAFKDKMIVKHGVVLLEVYTIDGIYYILYNSNQRGNIHNAYYISSIFANYQNGNNKYTAFPEGEYFIINYPDMLKVKESSEEDEEAKLEALAAKIEAGEEIDNTYTPISTGEPYTTATVNEFKEIAERNNWVLKYPYKAGA